MLLDNLRKWSILLLYRVWTHENICQVSMYVYLELCAYLYISLALYNSVYCDLFIALLVCCIVLSCVQRMPMSRF